MFLHVKNKTSLKRSNKKCFKSYKSYCHIYRIFSDTPVCP